MLTQLQLVSPHLLIRAVAICKSVLWRQIKHLTLPIKTNDMDIDMLGISIKINDNGKVQVTETTQFAS